MGWASGSRLADDIWDIVKDHLPEKKKKKLAKKIIEVFENMDCDTIMETDMFFDAFPESQTWTDEEWDQFYIDKSR